MSEIVTGDGIERPIETDCKGYLAVKQHLRGFATYKRVFSWRRLKFRYFVWLWISNKQTRSFFFGLLGLPVPARKATFLRGTR